MIVHLSADSPARLDDLDRLDRLHAESAGPPDATRLTDWCSLDDDGEHVWLDVAACRSIGMASLGTGWAEGFDAMVDFAASRGWTDEDGRRVRAHIERTDLSDDDRGARG